jgi:hypothetical protein
LMNTYIFFENKVDLVLSELAKVMSRAKTMS